MNFFYNLPNTTTTVNTIFNYGEFENHIMELIETLNSKQLQAYFQLIEKINMYNNIVYNFPEFHYRLETSPGHHC